MIRSVRAAAVLFAGVSVPVEAAPTIFSTFNAKGVFDFSLALMPRSAGLQLTRLGQLKTSTGGSGTPESFGSASTSSEATQLSLHVSTVFDVTAAATTEGPGTPVVPGFYGYGADFSESSLRATNTSAKDLRFTYLLNADLNIAYKSVVPPFSPNQYYQTFSSGYFNVTPSGYSTVSTYANSWGEGGPKRSGYLITLAPGASVDFNINGGSQSWVISGNVPEPTSWALMLTGFGLLGVAIRRRRPGSNTHNRRTWVWNAVASGIR